MQTHTPHTSVVCGANHCLLLRFFLLRVSQDEFNGDDPNQKQKTCDTLRSNPMVLCCSINTRARPRHRLAMSQGIRPHLSYLYTLTDAQYCKKIGKCSASS